MEKNVTLTKEEMDSIIQLRGEIRENTAESGRLNIQKHFIQAELDVINLRLSEVYKNAEHLDAREKEKIDEIVAKYGEGQLDFATGIYQVN